MTLDADVERVWREITERRHLTGRGAAAIRRVARTVADLDDDADVRADHLEEAAGMREDVP